MRTGVWTQLQTWRLVRSVVQKDTAMAWSVFGALVTWLWFPVHFEERTRDLWGKRMGGVVNDAAQVLWIGEQSWKSQSGNRSELVLLERARTVWWLLEVGAMELPCACCLVTLDGISQKSAQCALTFGDAVHHTESVVSKTLCQKP